MTDESQQSQILGTGDNKRDPVLEELLEARNSFSNLELPYPDEYYDTLRPIIRKWAKKDPDLFNNKGYLMALCPKLGLSMSDVKKMAQGFSHKHKLTEVDLDPDVVVTDGVAKGKQKVAKLMLAIQEGDISLDGDVVAAAIQFIREQLVIMQLEDVNDVMTGNKVDPIQRQQDANYLLTSVKILNDLQKSMMASEGIGSKVLDDFFEKDKAAEV